MFTGHEIKTREPSFKNQTRLAHLHFFLSQILSKLKQKSDNQSHLNFRSRLKKIKVFQKKKSIKLINSGVHRLEINLSCSELQKDLDSIVKKSELEDSFSIKPVHAIVN